MVALDIGVNQFYQTVDVFDGDLYLRFGLAGFFQRMGRAWKGLFSLPGRFVGRNSRRIGLGFRRRVLLKLPSPCRYLPRGGLVGGIRGLACRCGIAV